ncbi:MAG TPA: hypothetical protein VF613_15630, partial [Longimicrobium sp.]
MTRSSTLRSSAVLLVFAAACAPAAGGGAATGPTTRPGVRAALEYVPLSEGLPPIRRVEGPLAIRVVNPGADAVRPRLDSTFIYGTVGTGGAALTINGTPVPVAPNGAFIAYLPLPASGRWELNAFKDGQTATHTVTYRAPAAPAATAAAPAEGTGVFASPRAARVTGGADTLATGSDAVYARPTPTGGYRWFFPRGTRLTLAERRGSQYRAQLDDGTAAWIDASAVTLADTTAAAAGPAALGAISVAPAAGWVDVRIPAQRAPFLVEPGEGAWTVTLYGVTAQAGGGVQRDPMLVGVGQEAAGPSTARVRL